MPLHLPYYHGRIGGGKRSYKGDSGVVYQHLPELLGYDLFTSRSLVHGTQDKRNEAYATVSNLTNASSAVVGMQGYSANYNIGAQYLPGTSTVTATGGYYRWSDWGNDVFDGWGYFQTMNEAADTAVGINFGTTSETQNTTNTNPVEVYNRFQGVDGKMFQVVKGYIAQGICRILITCEDPDYAFRVYMGGNMGSDSGTNRSQGNLSNPINPPSGFTSGTPPSDPDLGWINDIGAPIHYIRNYQSVTTNTEQLHIWHLPIDREEYLPNSSTPAFTEYDGTGGSNDDDFSMLTDAYKLGHLFYLSKGPATHYDRVYFDVGTIIQPNWNAYQEAP